MRARARLEHADAMAERLALAERQLATAVAGWRARLQIGAFPTALAALIRATIARLRVSHLGTKVVVDEGTDELPGRIRSGELHLAIAFQESVRSRRGPAGMERRDIFREQFMVAPAPGHRLAERAAVPLAELSGENWTAPSVDGPIAGACRAAGFEPNVVSITHEQLAIRALVARGLVVTLVPQLLTEAFRDLVLRPIAGSAPTRDVYALLPPGGRHPLVAPALDAVQATAAELQAAGVR